MNDFESREYHSRTIYNRVYLERCTLAGCISCLRVVSPAAVTEWCDDDTTALCPHCSVDALIPGLVDTGVLEELHRRWFGGSSNRG